MKRISLVFTFVVFLIASFIVWPSLSGNGGRSAAQEPESSIHAPISLDGVLHGAPYAIRVPANWNGTLLVYAHIYRFKGGLLGFPENRLAVPTLSPRDSIESPEMEAYLLERGYALAGSAFRENGWAVEEGKQDTLALTKFFTSRIGRPRRTIIMGASMGSLVALHAAENLPNVYDGAICLCGATAGFTRLYDFIGDTAVAYAIAFGWPSQWGTVENVRDNLDFETEVLPVVLAQLQNPVNRGRWEFFRLVNRLPLPGFYDNNGIGLLTAMFYATEGRAEMEQRAGGPGAYNLDHSFTLTDAEKLYLAGLGVDVESLLRQMNLAGTSLYPEWKARRYVEQNYEPTGWLRRPVLTLKSPNDINSPANEWVLRATVRSLWRGPYLAFAWTNNPFGHCNFTQEQLLASVQAMERWIRTGSRPTEADFPASSGFLHGYEPPPWPQPIHLFYRWK